MGKFVKHINCPECGGPVRMIRRRPLNYKCVTDGCDVQKVHVDESGKVIGITRSSVAYGTYEVTLQHMKDVLLIAQGAVVT